jgi:hypothetical protein
LAVVAIDDASDDDLRAVRLGPGGRLRVSRQALSDFLARLALAEGHLTNDLHY